MSERITITIQTGNAAFAAEPATEIARILHDLASEWAAYGPPERLYDYNGNRCGIVAVQVIPEA